MSRKTFFDTLCFGELENVLLLMSQYPQRNEWFENVDYSIKYQVMEEVSPFAEVLREWCSTTCEHKWSRTGNIPYQFNDIRTLLSATDKLKYVALSRFHVLELSSPFFRDHFAEQSTLLTHLRLEGCTLTNTLHEYEVLLTRVGVRLQSIRIDKWISDKWPRLISSYCQVRELFLSGTGRGPVANQEFWKKVGPVLRTLGIVHNGYLNANEREIELERVELMWIKKYCCSLHSLILDCADGKNNTHFAECLASYGPRLRYTSLTDFNESDTKIIVNSCPNVRVRISSHHLEDAAKISRTLGNQLEELSFYPSDNVFSGVEKNRLDLFEQSMKHCTSLRKLYTRAPICCLSVLMITRKPDLLEVSFEALGEKLTSLLNSLAKSTGSLRKFSLISYPPTKAALNSLLVANPGMQEVILEVFPPVNEYGENLEPSSEYQICNDQDQYRVELIEALKSVPSLQRFDLSTKRSYTTMRSKRIANACLPLRYLMAKPVIVVDRWQYLPSDAPIAGSEWHGLTLS